MIYNYNYKIVFSMNILIILDYFIKKLYITINFYIEGIFVYPYLFIKLIVNLYYYSTLKKVLRIVSLVNNKKKFIKCYLKIFYYINFLHRSSKAF